MTSSPARPWPALSPVRRFGPLVLVVALVVGAGVVATAKGKGTETPGRKAPTESVAKSYVDNPVLPVLYSQAKEDGTLDDYDWGDRCDPETGRNAFPSVYAPPCVPVWDGT
ncbi:MAG TPA: hypothetical protein VNS19_12690, partial [Acidimicrobiales bacterium]|nr:hypothetical protein [Acidimicrobiales bacterium]